MIELLSAAAEAMASLLGPVASFAYRRSGQKFFEPVLDAYSNPTRNTMERIGFINRKLADLGIGQGEVIALSRFCASDEGAFCFRLIAINALAGNALKSELIDALSIQVAAMIRLHARMPKLEYADHAAKVIVGESSRTISENIARLRRRDPQLAAELREIAIEQSRISDLLKESQLRARSTHIEELSASLPTAIEEQIREYCELTASDFRDLTVASGSGASLAVPIDENVINTTVHYRYGRRKFVSSLGATQSVLPALLARHRYVVLLGDPGGGKSTAVRVAMHQFARAQVDGESSPVPFIVTLRHYARALRLDGDTGFVQYIFDQIAADHDQLIDIRTLRYLLHSGKAAVMFDGLDEVIDIDTRRQVVDKIEKFTRRFAATPIVVTSRQIGYDQAALGAKFTQFVLREFDESQVERFAKNVFNATKKRDDVGTTTLLEEFMKDSKAVKDLRSNPLLLGVLCLLYSSSHRIPTNRLQLYRRCATMLFDVWDDERGIFVPLIDAEAAEQAVREVALLIFETGEEEISESSIKAALVKFYQSTSHALPRFRAQAFADDAFRAWTGRKWILAFAGDDDGEAFFRFSHRTFLEYFAAEQVVYESETASDAWNRIGDYVRSGAATPFCELVIQMMATKTRGAADKMATEALAEVDSGTVDEEESLSILQLFSAIIGGLRVSDQTRESIFWADLTLLTKLAPWDSIENLRKVSEPPFLGYRSVFGDQDPEDQYWADGTAEVTIDQASSILKGFMSLEQGERVRILQLARNKVAARVADSNTRWIRLVYTLRQIPDFEDWQSTLPAWRAELAEFAEGLWSTIGVAIPTLNYSSAAEVDYWLVGALLRDELIHSPSAVATLGWRGLLIGGWPYPVLSRPNVGTPLHAIARAANGFVSPRTTSPWDDSLVDEICASVQDLLDTDMDGINAIVSGDSESARGSTNQVFQSLGSRAEIQIRLSELPEVQESRVNVASSLLNILDDLGDQAFVNQILSSCSQQWYAALREAGLDPRDEYREQEFEAQRIFDEFPEDDG